MKTEFANAKYYEYNDIDALNENDFQSHYPRGGRYILRLEQLVFFNSPPENDYHHNEKRESLI